MSKKILSDKFYHEMDKLGVRYPTKLALLLPALHIAQDELGWLPPDALDEVANYIGILPSQVVEVASFYSMYYLKPVGRHVLRVCTNVACCLRGSKGIVKYCEKKLNIQCGETTSDGKFTLLEEECLGACGTAPAMMLDHEYYENLNVLKLDQILDDLKD